MSEIKHIAMNIVNQLFDAACVDVDTRQKINDRCDKFVEKLILQAIKDENEKKAERIEELEAQLKTIPKHFGKKEGFVW